MLSHAALARSCRGRSQSTGFRWVGSFAMVSLLAPTILLAGFAQIAHEMFWQVWYGGGLPPESWLPDAPIWLAWLAALMVLAQAIDRRFAATRDLSG